MAEGAAKVDAAKVAAHNTVYFTDDGGMIIDFTDDGGMIIDNGSITRHVKLSATEAQHLITAWCAMNRKKCVPVATGNWTLFTVPPKLD